ncbi:hypothetical protein [Nocardia nova]|uniref:DUF8020 domain-containing protein n=1 Tax=Nocardia nova SH22a TaxID=1415166 RepID=W5TNU5_9NOCA|nr:hypothetical protein [Nocardia nova]AHH21040.1 hypothetical protein NONO_c62700 [Nocardia nova SH22a]
MKTRTSLALGSALTIAALTIAGGTANADAPAAPQQPGSTLSTDVLPGIHYTANVVDHSVVLRTDGGRLNVRGNQFEILDDNGNLVAGMPLTYKRDQRDWPIAAQVDGRTAVLTPSTNPADAVASATPDLTPVDDDQTAVFNDALGVAANQIGLATGLGVLVGTAIGLVGGCVAGALVGTALMPPIFFAGAPGGCLAGGSAGVALGAAAGTIILGVPVAIISGIQFFDTINKPRN